MIIICTRKDIYRIYSNVMNNIVAMFVGPLQNIVIIMCKREDRCRISANIISSIVKMCVESPHNFTIIICRRKDICITSLNAMHNIVSAFVGSLQITRNTQFEKEKDRCRFSAIVLMSCNCHS